MERGDGTGGILASLVETYPAGSELCEIRAGGTRRNPRAGMCEQDFLFHMQGKPLFRQASALIEGYLDRLLSASGLTLGQIATVVPHQASHLSLEHMRKRLHVSSEALVDIYRHHGNQVAASIPTALHAAVTTGRFNPAAGDADRHRRRAGAGRHGVAAMRVLVSGATSGLGRNAAEWLLEGGHQVRATGRDELAGEALRQLGAEFYSLDLAQATPQQCRELVTDCEWVWHCAAKSSPWGSKAEFHRINAAATDKLAEAAGRCGVRRFVHISTPAIYFDFQPHYDLDEGYRARRFANHYAASKHAAEQRLLAQAKIYPQTTYIILRPRGLFGPHDRVIVPRLLQQLERDRGVLRLPGGGQALLDLTFAPNVVHAMELASRQRGLPSGAVYNITNHQPQRLAEMLDALLRQELGLRYRLQAVPYPLLQALAGGMELWASLSGKEPLLTRYSVAAVHFDMTLSQTRAIEELGYRPRYSMEEGSA